MGDETRNPSLDDRVIKIIGPRGRMLGASKTDYLQKHPTHLVTFNANLFTARFKFWYGDIDVTLELSKLMKIAKLLNTVIYLFREMDGRFETETDPDYKKAVLVVEPNGNSFLGVDAARYFMWNGEFYQNKTD